MERKLIAPLAAENECHLPDDFIASYATKPPPFGPLGAVVHARTYAAEVADPSAPGGVRLETWTETCRRCVEGMFGYLRQAVRATGQHYDTDEGLRHMREAFDLMWRGIWTPPGRGLEHMGRDTVKKKGAGVLQNCGFVSTARMHEDPAHPFCVLMDYSMLGIGMGFDTLGARFRVRDPLADVGFVHVVEDSREGWVAALRALVGPYFGRGMLPGGWDFTAIRPAGARLSLMGGYAAGPEVLRDLLRDVDAVLRARVGQRLGSEAIVDVMTLIGRCVAAGQRRSAEIALGQLDDEAFAALKAPEVLDALHAQRTELEAADGLVSNLDEAIAARRAVASAHSPLSAKYLEIQRQIAEAERERREACEALPGWVELTGKIDAHPLNRHRWAANNSYLVHSADELDAGTLRRVADGIRANGEPGLFFVGAARTRGRFCDPPNDADAMVAGVNPCVIGSTRVSTPEGLRRIDALCGLSGEFAVVCDRRVEPLERIVETGGTEVRGASVPFLTGRAVPVFRVTTARGYQMTATAYHRFPMRGGFRELRELGPGDELLLQSGEGRFGRGGSGALGKVLGWLAGDGSFSDDGAVLWFYDQKRALAAEMLDAVRSLVTDSDTYSRYSISIVDTDSAGRSSIRSTRLTRLLAEFGVTPETKTRVPEVVWTGTRDCVVQYLRWLFGADGTVLFNDAKRCVSVRLSSVDADHLREVQQLLLHLGIASSLYCDRQAPGPRMMPDGAGGMKEYECKSWHELVISRANMHRFAAEVGFVRHEHADTFRRFNDSRIKTPAREAFADVILSIEPAGEADVYCLTEPATHTFVANGIVTGNCGEQPLEHMEVCTLVETYPSRAADREEWQRALKWAHLYGVVVTTIPTHAPATNAVIAKNRRIGTSITGVWELYERLGASELGDWLDRGYREVRHWNDVYSAWMGIRSSVRVTTVKPSGTVSLLFGVEGGMKVPTARHYMRTVRMQANSPVAGALARAGYRVEPALREHGVVVAYFPCEAAPGRVAEEVSLWEQAELAALLQDVWSDNAVSATLTFQRHEASEIERVIALVGPRLKGVAMLPLLGHGYPQAPYIPCTPAEVAAARAALQPVDLSLASRETAEAFCDGGACEVRAA